MNDDSKKITMEDVNRNLHATFKVMISKPLNNVIACAAFADRNNPNDYEDVINPEYEELLDSIENLIHKYVKDNDNKINFSTYESTFDSLELLSKNFFLEETHNILEDLVSKYEKKIWAWGILAAHIIMNRVLSLAAFANGHYQVSYLFHETAKETHLHTVFTNIHFMTALKNELSRRNRKSNDARWKGHVEQLRRHYLSLDEIRQGSSNKKQTIKAVAQWICEHHNDEQLELETIRDHLSKARKGIFTNS
ncbi:hypothetical protein ES754_10380 [Psychrobacter frigidicola]|uniref:Uncharacterized protein n=1 Tax=Psychrobacter frigidicola TaxID=45611 RepID=A0A5C6ZZP1_9GAMM|nr:hypothetical protein [Psychrobacter frigidicola]TXD96535.1 hypothetical protein ES754_10380 [Psychrobacter frigidicola]